VYVYLFHQFDGPIVLNVADEIARAPDPGPLRDLFPLETVSRVDQAYQRLIARSARCNAIGLAWLGLVAASLAALLLVVRSRRQALAFWAPVLVVLGPVGLVVWLIAAGGRRASALVEVVGDLIPYVVGMVAALLGAVLVPAISQASSLQLLAFYSLPLLVGLVLYQAPVLAVATRRPYLGILLARLPIVLVSTNLALAGLLAVSMPVVRAHLDYCGYSTWTVLPWWAINVLGATGGGLFLYAYHAWAVRRGFAAWSALSWGSGGAPAVSSTPWRRLWLWVALSLVALLAGILLGAMGSALVAGMG